MIRRPTGASRGQTLAEFALVIPVFLLIMMGLFDLGRAVFIYNGLTNAAREGARLAIVNQDNGRVLQRAQAMSFGVALTTPPSDIVALYRQTPNTDDVESNEPCDNSDDEHAIAVGCVAVVEADATWQPITPIIGNIVGTISLTAQSELPIEFVCPNAIYPAYATADLCPKQP
jgi:Flp pilus assembly protein TadG